MRDGVGDPARWVPSGHLEQGPGLLGEPQGERHVGLALLRGLLHPAAEHQYPQLSLFPDSLEELEDLVV